MRSPRSGPLPRGRPTSTSGSGAGRCRTISGACAGSTSPARTYLSSRPPEAEEAAIAAVAEASAATGCRTHVLPLSAAAGLDDPARPGARISVETCPHYLTFTAEEIPDGATEYKCAPPIRDAENRERLWLALGDGRIAAIVSDHSPCTPDLKAGSFFDAWGGIGSVQLGLRAVWTAARARGFP